MAPEGAREDGGETLVTAGIMEKDGVKSEIRSWERKLKEALKTEDYETAALCRDKIRALKEGIETDA